MLWSLDGSPVFIAGTYRKRGARILISVGYCPFGGDVSAWNTFMDDSDWKIILSLEGVLAVRGKVVKVSLHSLELTTGMW